MLAYDQLGGWGPAGQGDSRCGLGQEASEGLAGGARPPPSPKTLSSEGCSPPLAVAPALALSLAADLSIPETDFSNPDPPRPTPTRTRKHCYLRSHLRTPQSELPALFLFLSCWLPSNAAAEETKRRSGLNHAREPVLSSCRWRCRIHSYPPGLTSAHNCRDITWIPTLGSWQRTRSGYSSQGCLGQPGRLSWCAGFLRGGDGEPASRAISCCTRPR